MRVRSLLHAVLLALPVTLVLALTPAGAAPPTDPVTIGGGGGGGGVTVTQARGEALAGSYIVVLRDGEDGRRLARKYAADPEYVYSSALSGFAATLSPRQVEKVRRDPAVLAVEQDQPVVADATQAVTSGGGLYGLDRTDQRALPLSGGYTYAGTAGAVTAYVIDTGIATAHPDFGGRAANVYDALGGNGQDCNGHGTHVAGTIGGTTYGLAKAVRLRGVRVLGCNGSGSTAGIIAAVDWVRSNAVRPAVANLSLGGGYSSALNNAVSTLSASGVFVAVAAGNENQNACNASPASAPAATTVAASDKTDTRASFSNYGSCVDTYAPGVGISSTWLSGGTNTISGTSMASPHVAAVAALYKGRYGDTASSTVDSWITSNATGGVIRGNPGGTVNRLLFSAGL